MNKKLMAFKKNATFTLGSRDSVSGSENNGLFSLNPNS